MIVCLCEGLNDSTLRRVIRDGCPTVTDLARCTGVGTHCGACGCDLKRLVAEVRGDEAARSEEIATLPLAAK